MSTIKMLKDKVLIVDLDTGERKTSAGVIIPDDDMKDHGIRPRTATVYAVADSITDLKVGDKILLSHGRWSRGIKITDENGEQLTVRAADYPDGILMVLLPE